MFFVIVTKSHFEQRVVALRSTSTSSLIVPLATFVIHFEHQVLDHLLEVFLLSARLEVTTLGDLTFQVLLPPEELLTTVLLLLLDQRGRPC